MGFLVSMTLPSMVTVEYYKVAETTIDWHARRSSIKVLAFKDDLGQQGRLFDRVFPACGLDLIRVCGAV